MDEQISSQVNEFKTDEKELEEVLSKYDLDEALEVEFNAIETKFQHLLIEWLCQNPEHSSVAPAQPKSWNK
jgi:hypothetical protein